MTLYRWLLLLYPREFRRRFGPEMLALFAQNAAAADPTLGGRVAFWRETIVDSCRAALRERLPERLSLNSFASDVRQAWRAVARAPFVTVLVVLLMALSIGSTTAVFSVVNAVLLRPLPFGDPDRIVLIWERRSVENPRNNVAGHEFPEWASRSRSFERMAAIAWDREYNLTGAGEPLRLVSPRVTSAFFDVMGVAPQIGRALTAEDDRPESGAVVVLSDHLWRSRFNGDPQILGKTILLSDNPFTVIGVMPPGLAFPAGAGGQEPDIWTPIAEPIQRYRGRHYLAVVARLKEGVSIAQAQTEMDGIAGAIATELPAFSKGHGANIQPLHGELVRLIRRALLVLFAGVALVLAIGCCNVANLLLARAAARQQEIAVRIALGAGRLRIARQLLAEGGVLALAGGASGVLLASWLVAIARAWVPGDVPRLPEARIDATALVFAAGISMLTALVFGLVPLVHVARVQVADRLKHGGKGVARPTRQPLRRGLLVLEVALTVAVATGTALLLQSFTRLMRVDPGFSAAGVLAMDIVLPSRYASAASQRAFTEDALARLQALPDVMAVASTNLVPHGAGASGIAIAIEGRPPARPGEEPSASYRVVSPDYFKALGIPIVAGRGFAAMDARRSVPLIRWFPQQPRPAGFDQPQAPPVAVINEVMARAYWPNEDPIGRRFTALFSPPITVVGVARNARNRALADEAGPEFYLSHAQEPSSKVTFLIRSSGPVAVLPASVRSAIWSIDRDLPAGDTRTLSEIVDGNLSTYRTIVTLMTAFAVLALLLMTLGVYAIVAFITAQRTYEIGVRLALGAQPGEIRRLVLVHGSGFTAAGIALGLAGAYALARFASSLLYEVRPGEPLTYAALSALVLAITLAAAWGPARRAQRVDPVSVLRND